MSRPVFAFATLTSGAREGAIVHDMRVANELHRRGYKVVVYWMMERNPGLLVPDIAQRVLIGGLRYCLVKPNAFLEGSGAIIEPRRTDPQRLAQALSRSDPAAASQPSLRNVRGKSRSRDRRAAGEVHEGRRGNPSDADLRRHQPLALAAKRRGRHPFDFLVKFQGEEILANFIEARRPLAEYYSQLRRCVAASPWKAISLSADYARRLEAEMGLDPARLTVIHAGIVLPKSADARRPSTYLRGIPRIGPDVPIVAYFGRQDSEKGIDLLLYASRMLRERGVDHQLVACGGTSFGHRYHDICREIAQHLRLKVFWRLHVSDELRSALFAHSRCMVYPAIHREPLGMVAPEAMAFGTPILVPNHGGIAETVRAGDAIGGLTFRVWDTGDLAAQLERLLRDDVLHASLAAKAREVAKRYSIEAEADGLLAHLGLPMRP